MQGLQQNEVASIDHPASLFLPYEGKVRRAEILERAFLLSDVLSPAECAHYVTATLKAGYQSLEKTFPTSYRSNERVVSFSSPAAAALFNRISPFFTSNDCNVLPMGPGGEGLWTPFALNECLKFSRYNAGCRFAAHIDGPWTPATDLQSIYTVVVYLNDSFTGGETNFLDAREDGTHKLVESVTPKAGSVLIFKHEMLHEGAELTSGVKYILRTEVIFRRQESMLHQSSLHSAETNRLLEEIAQYYKDSERYLKEGDTKRFVEHYLKAIELQKQSTRSVPPLPFALHSDLVVLIFSYLTLSELRFCMQVSKSWYRVGRSNALWMRKVERTFPRAFAQRKGDLSADWLATYRQFMRKEAGLRIALMLSPMRTQWYLAKEGVQFSDTPSGWLHSHVTVHRTYRTGAWHSGSIAVDQIHVHDYGKDLVTPSPPYGATVKFNETPLFDKKDKLSISAEGLGLFMKGLVKRVELQYKNLPPKQPTVEPPNMSPEMRKLMSERPTLVMLCPPGGYSREETDMFMSAAQHSGFVMFFAQTPLLALRTHGCSSGVVIAFGYQPTVSLVASNTVLRYAPLSQALLDTIYVQPAHMADIICKKLIFDPKEKDLVGPSIVITGQDKVRATWAAELQAALLKHDPTWRVRKSADIATDLLAAAARIDLDYGVYTLRNKGARPLLQQPQKLNL